ncbi:conjugal transfer protein TraD [Flavobacterium tructae]|uniref:Conjugal transfer protein TraD n=1 Tax=Flavobacterium tructae TaxID=1114873 RepID=A0A1S1IZ64_9FLAO|nr:conjugal transfer protein TraD [Flavobacterium tructae]OHT43662.1 conjugal transfer protein TraD [Flavobacterium tructae]OXB15893.1 conjugal transfer protein TraD [Flavobacterium tructae]
METLIFICLLLVIALLLQDKITISIMKKDKHTPKETNPNLPDLMGQPKTLRCLQMTKNANGSQGRRQEQEMSNFDIEIDQENLDKEIPQEELNDVFRDLPDLEQEEEEWNGYGMLAGNDGFAQGVTFEELSAVGMLLEKEKLEQSQKETAIALVQKIQGTELFTLLENSIESASRKIAQLLDGSLSSEKDSGSSYLRKVDLNDFDIGDFV